MSQGRTIHVGEWVLEPSLNRISDGARQVTLEPLAASVLEYLARHPLQVVSADELIEHLWGRRFVGDSPVYRIIAELRRELGDDARQPRYIETIRKRGYRLVAPVAYAEPQEQEPGAAAGPGAAEPTTGPRMRARYAVVAALLVVAGAFAVLQPTQPETAPGGTLPVVAVMPFESLSDRKSVV